MRYRLSVTGPAKDDIARNRDWWAEHRSAEQAGRWFLGVEAAVLELAETADRYGYATEGSLRRAGVKQVSFGLGRRPSHRILYAIKGEEVVIYRVMAFKQDAIGVDDLTGD